MATNFVETVAVTTPSDGPSTGRLYDDSRNAFSAAFGPAGEVVAIMGFVMISMCVAATIAMWFHMKAVQKRADARADADAEKIQSSIETMGKVAEMLPVLRTQRAEFLQELRYNVDKSTQELRAILLRMEKNHHLVPRGGVANPNSSASEDSSDVQ